MEEGWNLEPEVEEGAENLEGVNLYFPPPVKIFGERSARAASRIA